MAEVNFKSLQALHESLLQKQQNITEANQNEFVSEVKAYIEQAKKAGSIIPSTRERDQIRANLRYWANYIYSVEKTFPDTELAPSTVSEKRPVGTFLVVIVFILLVLFGGIQTFRSVFGVPVAVTEPPVSTEEIETFVPATEPPVTTPEDATPTSVFDSVALVALTSPENGANVLPKVQFTGVSVNLKTEDSIHLLIVRGDLFFPIKEFVPHEQLSANGEWKIDAFLYTNEKELEQPENLIVVPALCFDQQCRDDLDASVETGIGGKNLPSQLSFRLYQDSSRVLFRNAYQAVVGTRLIYSLFAGSSYDLFLALPDGTPVRQITDTEKIHERQPQLSADGRTILYVQVIRTAVDDYYSIRIMDSDGKNDREVVARTTNVLESPQWSPDPAFISYTEVESRGSSTPYSSIHLFNLETQEDRSLTGEPYPFVHRFSSWIPNENSLVFNTAISDRTRFIQISIDSQTPAPFFDPQLYVSQPQISLSEDSYLMTYIAIGPGPNFLHDVYVTIDSDGDLPFDGTAVRLIKSTGELLDFPMLYPEDNTLYFTKHGSIYQVEYQITDGIITLKPNNSANGEIVIKTSEEGDRVEPIYFDIAYIEAFFPLDQTPVTPPP